MNATEVDGEGGILRFGWATRYSPDWLTTHRMSQFLNANGPVIMDASILCCHQILVSTPDKPLSGQAFVAKTDCSDGSCGVTFFTRLAAWSVQTK